MEHEPINEINYKSKNAADQQEKKRLTDAALAFHCDERIVGPAQNYLQGFDEAVKQTFAVALIPGQAASRRGSCRSWRRSDHRCSRNLRGRSSRRGRSAREILGQLRKL